MQITYIWHDCFLVRFPDFALVFDYWCDERGIPGATPDALQSLPRDLPVYVIVSHFHKDHYNPAIFEWISKWHQVHYIVSRDVWLRMRHITSPTSVYCGKKVDADKVTVLRPGNDWQDSRIKCTALPSTDAGNSYLVEAAGRLIFHAGDLNAWIWPDESTPAEIAKARGDWRAALAKVVETVNERWVDAAFFPVDSRIGSEYWTGARDFVRAIKVARFFPMHFGLGDESERNRRRADALRFETYAFSERGEYIALASPGDTFYSGSKLLF